MENAVQVVGELRPIKFITRKEKDDACDLVMEVEYAQVTIDVPLNELEDPGLIGLCRGRGQNVLLTMEQTIQPVHKSAQSDMAKDMEQK